MLMITTFALNAGFNLLVGLLTAKYLGPSDFGRYALAQSIGVFLNTILIDWLRHAATRYYTGDREASRSVRATLDLTLGLCCLLIALISALAILLGFDFGLGLWLAAIAPLVGITNGFFDVQTALLRARFRDRPYAMAIVLKNLFSLVLVAGSAAWFHDPAITLAALCLSMAASMLCMYGALVDREATWRFFSTAQVRVFAAYAMPIVIGSILWQLMPLYNRTLLAQISGFEVSGQYSLAYDLGIRIVAAIGSALEVMLLQLAIRADQQEGREAAKRQLSLNLTIVFGVMAPVCTGLWLVMPSFQWLFVPQAFHGSFAAILTAMLPGLFAFSVLSFSIHQAFFIAQRTWPLLLSSLVALIVNIGMIRFLQTHDPVAIAFIQGSGFIASFLAGAALSRWILRITVPIRDLTLLCLATGLMTLAVMPLRGWQPGWATLVVSAAAGIAIFGAVVFAGDVGGGRGRIVSLWRRSFAG